MRSKRGFTLYELLVVLLIISILAGMVFYAYIRFLDNARNAKCLEAIKSIKLALTLYKKEYKQFPPSSDKFDDNGKWLSASDTEPNSLFKYLCGEASFQLRGYSMDKYVDPGDVDQDGKLLDPWGNPIRYQNNIADRKNKNLPYTQDFYLRSFGPNGQDDSGGGDDINAFRKFDLNLPEK